VLILYCEQCGVRVDEAELQSGAAIKINANDVLCPACSKQHRATQPQKAVPVKSATLPAARADRSAAHAAAVPGHTRATTAHERAVTGRARPVAPPATAAKSSSPMLLIAGGGVLALIAGVALLIGGGRRPAPTDSAAETTTAKAEDARPAQGTAQEKQPDAPGSATPETKEPPSKGELVRKANAELGDIRNDIAARRLDEAKAYFKQNSDDPYGYQEKLQDLVGTYRSTPAGQEAAKLLAELKLPDEKEEQLDESAWQQAVDVLALVDPGKDKVNGNWRMEGATLVCDPGGMARIEIPYEPPEEYDFRIVFTRTSGFEDVQQMLPHGGKAFAWVMANEKNKAMGFEQVDGKRASENRTTIRVDSALENGKTHTSIVMVRKRVVRAFLDGKKVAQYRTDYANLSARKEWALRNQALLGLGAHNNAMTFQKAQLREVTGTGKKAR
jgi:hypothetical protein